MIPTDPAFSFGADSWPKVPDGFPRPEDAECAVFLLGPIRVLRRGVPLVRNWRRKTLELLAYLGVHPQGASKDQILEALWPERDPEVSQKYLWRSVSDLRNRLRGCCPSAIRFVEKADDFYRLDFQRVWVDTQAFGLALQFEGAGNCGHLLEFACGLYKGEFCEGRYFNWATFPGGSLRDQFLQACGDFAKQLAAVEDPGSAWVVLQRALDLDPCNEELAREAMQMAAKLDRADLLVKGFRRLRSRLSLDLDAKPTRLTKLTFEFLMTTLEGRVHATKKGAMRPDGDSLGSPSARAGGAG